MYLYTLKLQQPEFLLYSSYRDIVSSSTPSPDPSFKIYLLQNQKTYMQALKNAVNKNDDVG